MSNDLFLLIITEKQKPIAGKKIMGKTTMFIKEDKAAILTIEASTKNSFEVNKAFSGPAIAIKKGDINNKTLSIGKEVRLFTVQKKNTITRIKLIIPAKNQ